MSQPIFIIRPERDDDAPAIEELLNAAFGPDRLAKRSYAFRDGVPPVDELSFVAVRNGAIIGTIRFWPVTIGRDPQPALLLGPLGIDADCKGLGLGSALVDHALGEATRLGHRQVILVGDPNYYIRFGFEPAGPHGIYMPGEQNWRVQVRGLGPFALAEVEGPVRKVDPADLPDQPHRRGGSVVPFRKPA